MIAVLDLETTGFDPEVDRPCEVAVVWVDPETGEERERFASLLDPGRPIPPTASAVHHITDQTLHQEGCLSPPDEAWWRHVFAPSTMIAAHSAPFDLSFLPAMDLPVICTWRCASHLWPDAPSHSNQCLRYWLPQVHPDLWHPPDLAGAQHAHRALYDALCTAGLLRALLAIRSASELVRLSQEPIVLGTVNFGKHRGEPWSAVPRSYLHWLLGQDFDSDTKHTARHYLGVT